MKQTADDLRRARKLIERPESWTKKAFWRDGAGKAMHTDEGAVAWSARGAIATAVPRVSGHFARTDAATMALVAQIDPLEADPMALEFYANRPTTTHADILALFDRAIAEEEANP